MENKPSMQIFCTHIHNSILFIISQEFIGKKYTHQLRWVFYQKND
nr:MAG TPA_asm: hypothetical protein [Bacteriophage sp.]